MDIYARMIGENNIEEKQNTISEPPEGVEVVDRDMIRVSVRSLVEFIFRSGDIDNRVGRGSPVEAMHRGSRMHQRIQRSMGSGYMSEVTLKHEVLMGHYVLLIEGRADGIFSKTVHVAEGSERASEAGDWGEFLPAAVSNAAGKDMRVSFIDEIKSMYTDVTRFEQPLVVHLAQAKCYAYIFALQNRLERMGVQITYCDLDSEKTRRFEEVYSFADLQAWFGDMIESYRRWTDHQWEWNMIRRDSILGLEFPFSYRKGQRRLVGDVYRSILREKILFLDAPTGTGKTIATVFPAVQAMGQGKADRIFYLTARTITRTVAEEAFDVLKKDGLRMKVITLTAREKICPCEVTDCNPVNCPRAKGHYDRVNDAVFDLMTTQEDYTRDILLAYAEKHRVCPYGMEHDLAMWSDAIICDYNYVFNPNAYLRGLFGEGEHADYVFLVDEAHNLVERGREMYSANLAKEDFPKFSKMFKKYDSKIASALDGCNRKMLDWKRKCEVYLVFESIDNFAFSLVQLMEQMERFLRKRGEFPERREITDFYFNIRHFVNMFDRMDENYVLYADFDPDGRFILHLYCVNPAKNLQGCINRGKSAVFFSATLLPIQYYKNLLSTRDDNYAIYAESSFKKEQRLLFVAGDVTSLYTRRNADEYQRIAAYIAQTARARRGNYIVYFPSYRFLEDVYYSFMENFGEADGVDCITQTSGMSERERETFMEEFSCARERSLVAFCVVGGIFAEGIDLPHDQLIGVLVVGTGLPMICNRREILKRYYDGELTADNDASDEEEGMHPSGDGIEPEDYICDDDPSGYDSGREGFSYAYQYPGMNKVMQAAGRVIRTADDIGVIGLLDERFLRRDYRELFPREWDDYRTCRLEDLPAMLENFWKEKK